MTKPKHVTVLQQCQAFGRNGWYPAPQAHLPAEIRQALRRLHIRPAMKQCFRNCQRFVIELDYEKDPIADRLTYCEGILDEWAEHAWLLLDGVILDLTLASEGQSYDLRHTATVYEIAVNIRTSRSYGSVKLGKYDDEDGAGAR